MNNDCGKTLADIFCDKYIIPLYQRNFAWRTDEIHQLLQDVYEACRSIPKRNYYIGSLVVLKRHNGDYEVVDGQQRLTVLSLIAILLKKLSRPVLSYDSRPEVQEFFEMLCMHSDNPEEVLHMAAPSLFYLKEACDFLRNAKIHLPDGTEGKTRYLADHDFAEYFMNHVILVRNEIPDDTDVAAYFEIMNNRGEQLQKHEIVKAQMMDNIKIVGGDGVHLHDAARQKLFARIWDACSRMDIPVHRSFTAKERIRFFGNDYNLFLHEPFAEGNSSTASGEDTQNYSLKEILIGNGGEIAADVENSEEEPEADIYAYGSIIDFPNFLMHVLRLYSHVHGVFADTDIPLNEKALLDVCRKNIAKIDSMQFAELLLFCRVAFDRFVVKSAEDAKDSEDGRKWVLIKPTRYKDNWKFTYSFDGNEGKQLVKALSMLQVTFRTRTYKTWLYEVMEWLHGKCWKDGNFAAVSVNAYLSVLHRWMLEYYKNQGFEIQKVEGTTLSQKNSYSLGTDTPHFLLNFIDYLYCRQEPGRFLDTFNFKYWNSIEHHLARNKVDDNCPFINNLGNLCLVSKSLNSRLSDRDVKEKVQVYTKGNLGPNRRVMYEETEKANFEWGEEQIHKHYNELVELLSTREKLCPVSGI